MQELVFASNNPHKLQEIRQILGDDIRVLSLSDIGCHDDIPETAETLQGNAEIKARYVWDKYGRDCFADDTGLMVDYLDGAPGVYSARFAGEHCSPDDNMDLLLSKLQGVPMAQRTARFCTCIALILNGETHYVTGEVPGHILTQRDGSQGFGYDPIFLPDGYDHSFGTMPSELKNAISHRSRAALKLKQLLDLKFKAPEH